MPTKCNPDLFGFARVEGRGVVVAFDGSVMTYDAGRCCRVRRIVLSCRWNVLRHALRNVWHTKSQPISYTPAR